MEEADKVSDRIAIIDHGKIIAQGTAEELKSKTTFDLLTIKKSLKAEAAYIVLHCFQLNFVKNHVKNYDWRHISNLVQSLKHRKQQFLILKKLKKQKILQF